MSAVKGRQIRAARALLGWQSTFLAEKVGLARETISKIEDESVQPRAKNLADIVRVFDENGIEFIDNLGVRFKPRRLEVYEGDAGFREFIDDLYAFAQSTHAEICVSGVDETAFIHHLGQTFADQHVARMTALGDVTVRCLICEGDTDVFCDSFNEYRWAPSSLFSAVPFYVYGKKFAVVIFEDNQVMVVVIDSEPVAKAYRKQFELIWARSKAVKALKKNNRKEST
jgi:DNA-binding XRE family transcriptional regulator